MGNEKNGRKKKKLGWRVWELEGEEEEEWRGKRKWGAPPPTLWVFCVEEKNGEMGELGEDRKREERGERKKMKKRKKKKKIKI